MKHIKKTLLICTAAIFISPCPLLAQSLQEENIDTEVTTVPEVQVPKRKRIIDKFEVFVGPSLSFNYGNKFLENYSDDNISNRRIPKPGYTFGLGIFHTINDRLDLNARLQYEQRGGERNLPIRQGMI